MYQIIECEQRSPEWTQARLGKYTMSFADKAVTSTGKASSQADEVVNRLVAELIVGEPDETFQSDAMARGSELEDEALKIINLATGKNFKKIGFLDSQLGYGCSPDGWDYEDEDGLEMKIPSLHTHLGYLAGGILPKKYIPQVQGSMMVTGAKSWTFVSYYPGLPLLIVKVERDEEFIDALRSTVVRVCGEVNEKYKKIKALID